MVHKWTELQKRMMNSVMDESCELYTGLKNENGEMRYCPHCKKGTRIYHIFFNALMCGRMENEKVVEGCGIMVDNKDWLLKKLKGKETK